MILRTSTLVLRDIGITCLCKKQAKSVGSIGGCTSCLLTCLPASRPDKFGVRLLVHHTALNTLALPLQQNVGTAAGLGRHTHRVPAGRQVLYTYAGAGIINERDRRHMKKVRKRE